MASLALGGCDSPQVSIDGATGVPLAEVHLAGATAHEITLLGPDTVHVLRGPALAIRVDGDARAKAALRFVLKDGKLGIGRLPGVDVGYGTATITVTDPAVDHLVMAGAGAMTGDALTGKTVGITVAGAGQVTATGLDAAQLAIEVLGSGSVAGRGHAGHLALTIAGTGSAELAGLHADSATIDVAGTGDGVLASDGKVAGSVVGTGEVTVHGKAQCSVSVTGTGRIVCQP